MDTKTLVESLLFISGRPMTSTKLGEILGMEPTAVETACEELMQTYNQPARGIHLQRVGRSYQLATNPQCAHIVKDFVKSEQTGELTKPSLETLTIIAYRGPITKAELEQIRGVNCSLILRNLLIKGLVESREDREKMATVYTITFDFLKFLGLDSVEELPEYEKLSSDANIKKLLERTLEGTEPAAETTP